MKLSDPQQKAVRHIGSPALVVAGAGSGKTQTLTAKFSHLISIGYDPKRILAITFTNKAAQEMKTRLIKMTALSLDSFQWVRTYHSACLMILKKHCSVMGYLSPIQIVTTYQQTKLIKELCVNNNLDIKYANLIFSTISRAKNSGNPEHYFNTTPRILSFNIIDLFNQYERRLMEMNSVDFDNILLKTRDLLRDHENICKWYQEYFSYILVDEYQDTNNIQEELTRLILGPHRNLFCVGDDWQAVYGFRGSNVNHFLDFPEKYNDANIFRLEENYRSADEIVQAANNMIDYNPDKMEKRCFSKKKGGVVEICDFMSDTEEADWIATRILAINKYGKGLPFEKIAVIYRTKFCSLPFEKTFRYYRIPYKLMGSQGFFERMEIMDLNAYLNASCFHGDDLSFERVLRTPKRGIGPAIIKKIGSIRKSGMSLQEAARIMVKDKMLTGKVHESLTSVLAVLDEIKDMTPDKAIQSMLNSTKYYEYLEKILKTRAEFISKKENIEQLIHTAQDKTNILEYLEEATLIREDKNEENENHTGVGLLTIHSAKGLEFDTVFIAGCEEGLFPHWRSIDNDYKGEALSEERRLMYVAMTRAERLLYLTYATYRKGQFVTPSRFIDQLKESLH